MLTTFVHLARLGVRVFLRLAWLGGLLLFMVAAATVLLARYWLLPNIERYHDEIVYAVANTIGQRASIGRIEADWHGLRPHLLLINVRVLDRQGGTALVLEKVESDVAWTSLLVGEVRLYSLTLDQPDLTIKRDAEGEIFAAGMPLSGAPSDGSSADWLLNQSRIEVRNARITWLDQQRAAPPLVFSEVNLLIDNGWRSHRFALRALPPKELSAQVDVRGDFHGATFGDMSAWNGQLFTQLDYADVAAWRTWFPLPIHLASGKGAVRGWLEVERGQVSQVTADLALSSVRTRLADDLPVIDLRTLHGRVGWRGADHGLEVSTQQLSLRLRNGFVLAPTNFYLRYAGAERGEPASGEVRANKLDLLGLSTLSEYLPFNRGFKRKLGAFAPRGRVSDLYANWQGDADKLLHFKVAARFEGMALRQTDGIPGFSGLTGRVDGTDESGTLSLKSRKLTVDAPGVMQEKLLFDTVSAQIGWQSGQQGLEMSFTNVAIANADMNGLLSGTYRTAADSPGVVDITGHLTHAAVQHVDRYIPISALNKETHAWLKAGLIGGRSDDASLRLAGDLGKFPFPDGKDGVFKVRAHIRDAAVEFLREWPRIEGINGELVIDGKQLEVIAQSATTAGNALHSVSALIPDLLSNEPSLQIYGEAEGDTDTALSYIRKSPVRRYLGGFTDDATALGVGELKLRLDIPLFGGRPVKVNGSYRFMGDDIDLGGRIPLLQQASGDLLFTESSVSSRNLAVKTLGGPAAVEVKSSEDGKVIRVQASGNSDMDVLRTVSPHPLLRYLHGGSPWELAVTVQNKQADVLFTSSLAGLASDLPAPLAKRAGEKIPLRMEQKVQDGQQSEMSLQVGALVSVHLSRYKVDGEWELRRGLVAFGKQKRRPEREGLWLEGEIPYLSLEGWGPLFEMAGGQGEAGVAGVAGADILVRKVTGYRQAIDNLRVSARSRDGALLAQLASRDVNGDITWQPQHKGLLRIRLRNLALSAGAKEDGGAGKPVAVAESKHGESPDIRVSVDNFSFKGKQLGRLDFQAKQEDGNWSLERVLLSNPDGALTADGRWLASGPSPQTQVNFKLEINDAGKILTRSGYPDSVKNGGGKLEGSLAWTGNPDDFNYAILGGTLRLDVGKGQFLKIDPGAGKLLSVLSLQPMHFADVFSKGFVFDSITCTAQVNQGILSTADFKIKGSVATVTMTGSVDLPHETQNLKVVILPEVGGGTALLVALAANPIAGISMLLLNKILHNPLEKMTSFEYNVTGTWAEPKVTGLGTGK